MWQAGVCAREDMQGKGSGGGRSIAGATCRLQAAWLGGPALGPPRFLGFRGEPQVRNPSLLTLTLNSEWRKRL